MTINIAPSTTMNHGPELTVGTKKKRFILMDLKGFFAALSTPIWNTAQQKLFSGVFLSLKNSLLESTNIKDSFMR